MARGIQNKEHKKVGVMEETFLPFLQLTCEEVRMDSTSSVNPFVCWIEEYPLPDGLKMPSHVGSYYGKGDPDNYLHLFEGAIRMQK
ncbi:hypothetical protein Tco_1473881 [Tanacetum coccineum]